jgi:hypothetical protein
MLILFFPTWSLTPKEEHDWRTKCCGEFLEMTEGEVDENYVTSNFIIHTHEIFMYGLRSVIVNWLNIHSNIRL